MQRPFYPPELDCEFGLKERGAFYGKKALGRKTGLVIWRTEHWLKVLSGRGGGEAGQDGESCPKLRDALSYVPICKTLGPFFLQNPATTDQMPFQGSCLCLLDVTRAASF